jgi:hypothetical protein
VGVVKRLEVMSSSAVFDPREEKSHMGTDLVNVLVCQKLPLRQGTVTGRIVVMQKPSVGNVRSNMQNPFLWPFKDFPLTV